MAVAIAALAVVEALAAAAHAKQAILACCEVYVPVRQRLVDAARQRDDAFNDRFGSADLLTRAGTDSEQVDILVAELGRLAGASAVCVAGIAVGLALDLWVGIVVAALVAVMTVAGAVAGAPLYSTTVTRSRASSVLNGLFTATLGGLATVSGLGLAGTLLARERRLAGDCHRAGVDLARVRSRIDALVRLAAALVVVDIQLAAVVLAWCALLLLPVTRWYCRRAATDVKVFFEAYEVFTDRFEQLTDGAPTARRFGRTDLAGRFDAPNTAEAAAYAQTHILRGRFLAAIALLRGGTVA